MAAESCSLACDYSFLSAVIVFLDVSYCFYSSATVAWRSARSFRSTSY